MIYVYAVTTGARSPKEGLPAMNPGSVTRSIQAGGLGAIVSDVADDEFGEEALPSRLNDLEWLESRAKAHQRVVDASRQRGPTVPMKFCTIYRDESGVRSLLEQHAAALEEALDEVTGRVEWGVKVLVDRSTLSRSLSESDTEVNAARKELLETTGGRSYWAKRRLEDALAGRTEDRLQELCVDAHARLCAVALDARINRPQSKALTEDDRDMVMNCSYLLEETNGEELLGVVAELSREHDSEGISFQATGPWSPYNFLTLDLGGESRP